MRVHQLGAEVGLQHALGLHGVPEPPLLLAGGDGKQLLQILHLHGVYVGPKRQRGHIGGGVVVLDHLPVQSFHLRRPPVLLCDPAEIGQLPPREADNAGVVDPLQHRPVLLYDGVELRYQLTPVQRQAVRRGDAAPAVIDGQALETAGVDGIQVQGPVQDALVAVNPDQARRPAR